MDILGYKMFLLGGAAYGINRWLYKRYFNPKTQTRFIEAAFKRKFSGLQPTLWKKSRLKGVTLHIDLNQGNQPIDAFFATKKEGLHLDVCEIVVINSKRILDPQTPEFSIVKDYTKLDDISMKELFMAINKHGLNENPHVCGLRISPPDQNSDLERRKSLRIEFDSVDRYLGTKKLEKMFKSKIEISEEELNDCFVFVFDHDQKQVIWLETARRDDQRSSMSRLVSHILAQKVMRSFPVKMDLSVEALEGISAVDNFEILGILDVSRFASFSSVGTIEKLGDVLQEADQDSADKDQQNEGKHREKVSEGRDGLEELNRTLQANINIFETEVASKLLTFYSKYY